MATVTDTPPTPLEWHPTYRDKTWLLDWINGNEGALPHDTIELPRQPTRSSMFELAENDTAPAESLPTRTVRLTRHKAWGAAPYVGDPFVYVWHYATDHVGRSIASDSVIVYRGAR